MNNLLFSVIILSIVVLTGYLCSPIEYMTMIDSKEVAKIYKERLDSDDLKNKINKINKKCKNKSVHNENCRKQYIDICEENAEDYLCTLYNKNDNLIVAKQCGQRDAESKEKLKDKIIESCNREVDDVGGDYITNDRDYEPLSSAFGKKQSQPAPWTPDRFPIKPNKLPDYRRPDCNHISQEQCSVQRTKALEQWETKTITMNKIKETNPSLYKQWKNTKPTQCNMFKEKGGIPCGCCNNCKWSNRKNICVEK